MAADGATKAAPTAPHGSSDRLSSLSPGQSGRIVSLAAPTGLEAQARRLADIGFVPGSVVTVERRAPLGDPTVYVLRGTRVALRRVAAEMILVDTTTLETPAEMRDATIDETSQEVGAVQP